MSNITKEELEGLLKDLEDIKEEDENLKQTEKELNEKKEEALSKLEGRKIKFGIFKKVLVIGTLAASVICLNKVTYEIGYDSGQESVMEDIKDNLSKTYDINNAPDEVLNSWANEAFSSYSDYWMQGDSEAVVKKIDADKKNYLDPMMQAYYDYTSTGDEKYHEDFINYACSLEKKLGENYSFDKSIYSYSYVKDGIVYLPASLYGVSDGEYSDNMISVNGNAYMPKEDISSKEMIK